MEVPKGHASSRGAGGGPLLASPSDAMQGSVGLLATETFCVPMSLIMGNSLHSSSMTFPEFHWADSSGC